MTMILRPEEEHDFEVIRDITARAFATMAFADGDEQDVIERLRAAAALTLSLVAEDEGKVIGQVTFSPAAVDGSTESWYALGPVAVEPGRQGEGVGAALIEEGLARLRRHGAAGCILTGDPGYYKRFGFRVMPELCPPSEPGEYFQVLQLSAALPKGRFAFHPAFYGDVSEE